MDRTDRVDRAEADRADKTDKTDKVDRADKAVPGGVVVLRPGDRGETVRRLQERLHRNGYYFGRLNGVYDEQTKFGVWAFQKHRHLRPQGAVGPEVWRAFDRPVRMKPLVPRGEADRVEINLRYQLLVVYRHRRPALISHVSTGARVNYCENGHCGNAITPTGDFHVTSRAPGWTEGPLGTMYDSLYFVGGIAMHGSSKVPLRPASHGCVRLPLPTSKRLFDMVKIGEPVYVREK
ncbi:L,D-transpeptidase family protein [Nonomuraea sp. NPDC001023]|uniref:L,D-transpeptidase family protein n=1 Tax=unclassified Nonomuraea TaxID=2593643 RepID=UPI003322E1A7